MAVILAGIAVIIASLAILLGIYSLRESSKWASKKALGEAMSRNARLQKMVDELQGQLSILQQEASPIPPSLPQPEVSSAEIRTLRTELASIQRDVQADSQRLSIQAQVLESIREKLIVLESAEVKSSETIQQKPTLLDEVHPSAQGSNPFPSFGSFAGLDSEQQSQPTESLPVIEEQPPRPPEPYEQVAQQYQDALDRGDRQALRQMQVKELNITSDSEEILLRGSTDQATKLQAVSGGGSYLLMSGEGRYWLFPTAQTLDSFTMNQPQKGIFGYEREILSRPAVKRPAEVREEGDYWVVVGQGVICIPG